MLTDRNGYAATALVLTLVALLFSFLPFVGLMSIPFSLVGIVFAAVAITLAWRGKRGRKAMSVTAAVVGVVAVFVAIVSTGSVVDEFDKATTIPPSTASHTATIRASSPSSGPSSAAPAVSAEYRAALAEAESYLATMPFSKTGLYGQLTAEAGSKYPKAAAQYAVDKISADWKLQAARAAVSYRDTMPMSDEALRQQLKFDGFTEAEVGYAIANQPK